VIAGNATVTQSVRGICVHTGGSETAVEIQLRSPLSKSQWWMRLRYTSSRSYDDLVPGSSPLVTVMRGLHDVMVPLGIQPLSHVVMAVPARTSLCLISADVEHPVPKTGASAVPQS
jgi:hypothetical protein